MDQLIVHTGIGVPLRRSNVDTDQIVPSVFLKRVSRTGFDDALFANWRRDPEFVLNVEPYSRGSVLVAGPDFGTGSSREHAVWALCDYGFRVVLAPRFGDIFRGNAGKRGLLVAVVAPDVVESIWAVLEQTPGTEVTVDLQQRQVRCGDLVAPFEVDDHTRWRILEGLDDVDLTLESADAITAFEQTRPVWRARTLPAKHLPPASITVARG